MGSTEGISNTQEPSNWPIARFQSLKQENTVLGYIARSCTGSSSSLEEAGKIGFVWDSSCTEKATECLNTGPSLSCVKAFSLCSGIETLIEKTQLLNQATSGTTSAINLTKNSIQALSSSFFKRCKMLPSLPTIENSQCASFDWTAAGIIGGAWFIQPYVINSYFDKETQLAKSISKGLVIGPVMAWAFNQDLYTGAITGAASAVVIDSTLSYALKPIFTMLNNLYKKEYIEKTFESQKTILKYGATVSALSLCYAHVGSLLPFLNNSPYSFVNLPISVALATGTFVFVLKYPVSLLQGIYDNTKNVIETIASSPEIPFIAYSSLYLTLYKTQIVNFAYKNFTYENCLKLYNNVSSKLLNCWNKGQNFEICEESSLALYTLAALGLLTSSVAFMATSQLIYPIKNKPSKSIHTASSILPNRFQQQSQEHASAFKKVVPNEPPPPHEISSNTPSFKKHFDSNTYIYGLSV